MKKNQKVIFLEFIAKKEELLKITISILQCFKLDQQSLFRLHFGQAGQTFGELLDHSDVSLSDKVLHLQRLLLQPLNCSLIFNFGAWCVVYSQLRMIAYLKKFID